MGKAARHLERRRRARAKMNELVRDQAHVIVIHYSCESFYDLRNGSSPRITSIACRNLESAQTSSFSIHQIAERHGYSNTALEQEFDQLERLMLDEFYDYVKSHGGYTWVHWNMRDINYGFQAIAHRYRVLKGEPVEMDEDHLVDLARLLRAMYGEHYVEDPRLQNIVRMNEVDAKDFLTGAEEAIAFEKKEYVKLHFSTLRKTSALSEILHLADEGTLKQRFGLKDRYSLYPQAIGEWIQENPIAQLVGFLATILGFTIAMLTWLRY